MSKYRPKCTCGSGKAMRRCCGAPSSQTKLNLEAAAMRFSEAGMHEEAAQVLMERARLSPQNPMVWNDAGVEYMAAGQTQEAHQAFRLALKALAHYTPSLYNLGRLAIEHCAAEKAKEHPSEQRIREFATEAVQYLEKSLSLDPLQHQTHAALSTAYSVMGDAVRATFHLKMASELKPAELAVPERTWVEQLFLRAFANSNSQAALPFLFSTGKEIKVSTSWGG